MTTYENIAEIINARGHIQITATEAQRELNDYDGWNVSAAEQTAYLAKTDDTTIALWLESALIGLAEQRANHDN